MGRLVQHIAPDGTATADSDYRLPPETLCWLYEHLVITRDLDGEFVNLQRQGELALLYEWVKPKALIPMHGEPRHLRVELLRAGPAGHGLAEIEELAVAKPRPHPALGLHDGRRLDAVDGGIDGE